MKISGSELIIQSSKLMHSIEIIHIDLPYKIWENSYCWNPIIHPKTTSVSILFPPNATIQFLKFSVLCECEPYSGVLQPDRDNRSTRKQQEEYRVLHQV